MGVCGNKINLTPLLATAAFILFSYFALCLVLAENKTNDVDPMRRNLELLFDFIEFYYVYLP